MKHQQFMDKTTRHFRNAIAGAFQCAAQHGTKVVTPLHLLYATLSEQGSIGEEILHRGGVKKDVIERLLDTTEVIPLQKNTLLSPLAKRVIEKAVTKAASESHTYIGTEHLVHGLLGIDAAEIEFVFTDSKVKRKDLEQQLNIALKSAGKLHELLSQMSDAPSVKQNWKSTTEKPGKQKTPALDYFATELTNPIFASKIDPVIGRDTEIERIIHILARRTKNNPILLGEPGVGKTAIIEGLAKRVVAGTIPPILLGKRIYAVDLGLMIAGTMYRGEFESRIKQMIDEVKANPDIILFIDEIHTIVGAGSSNGTLDAANLLKPALARGELRVIGATTFDEFKKHIEHDAALERRFQPIQVREPSTEETTAMLHHVKSHYERFHGVTVAPEAIEVAVELAERYFPEKRFPDKAIDLLDEAMSSVKIRTADVETATARAEIKQSIAALDGKKQKAILKENFEEAHRIKVLEQELIAKLSAFDDAAANTEVRARVEPSDIHTVVEHILRRPIKESRSSDSPPPSLRDTLQTHIFGQEETISTVAHAITRAQLGLNDPRRPLASFLFVGPSGVGKTELAKQIAHAVFGDDRALIKLDMTEFSEGFSVSKLMGAPAGYVGYKESTTLVDRIRRQPMSVILFDEVDKAHPDVLNTLLHMLEEGYIKDASGKEASVRQSIIVLTYQVPPEELRGSSFGFVASPEERSVSAIKQTLYSVMKPELLNRIDSVCVLRPLNEQAMSDLATRVLTTFSERLAVKSIALTWNADVVAYIASQARDSREGARGVRHSIESQIQNEIVSHLAQSPKPEGYHVVIKNAILTVEPLYGSTKSVPSTTRKLRRSTSTSTRRTNRKR